MAWKAIQSTRPKPWMPMFKGMLASCSELHNMKVSEVVLNILSISSMGMSFSKVTFKSTIRDVKSRHTKSHTSELALSG